MSKRTKPSPARAPLRVLVSDASGRRVSSHGLAAWLQRVAPARARGTVNVALVTDRQIRELNRTFRGVDKATDVLSFPARSTGGKGGTGRKGRIVRKNVSSLPPSLGDLAIARGVARRQAREAGHSETTEWRVLALHGLLHLLGYDHEQDEGRMQRVERKLRRKGGLREGLIDRSR